MEKRWKDSTEDLAEVMTLAPLMEQFVKQVKALVREKLVESPESIPGFKLRKGGNITTYEAFEVANILMSTNVLEWNDFLKGCRYVDGAMAKQWADKRGISVAKARADLKDRLKDIVKIKPKASSIIKDNG